MANAIGEAFGTVNWSGIGASVIMWIGYILLIVIVLGAFAVLFYYMQFSIKADTWTLYGSGKDGNFAFSKKKKNRLRWINQKTAWRPMFPLMNKMEIEPFDPEFVYPGKQVYSFIQGETWIPGRINLNKDENTLRAEINPVPYYVRNWQSLQHKKNAKEFAEHNWWEDNKYFFMVIVTAALCLVMVGVTVYFTYKFATGGTGAMNNLATAISSFNTIGGIGPH